MNIYILLHKSSTSCSALNIQHNFGNGNKDAKNIQFPVKHYRRELNQQTLVIKNDACCRKSFSVIVEYDLRKEVLLSYERIFFLPHFWEFLKKILQLDLKKKIKYQKKNRS